MPRPCPPRQEAEGPHQPSAPAGAASPAIVRARLAPSLTPRGQDTGPRRRTLRQCSGVQSWGVASSAHPAQRTCRLRDPDPGGCLRLRRCAARRHAHCPRLRRLRVPQPGVAAPLAPASLGRGARRLGRACWKRRSRRRRRGTGAGRHAGARDRPSFGLLGLDSLRCLQDRSARRRREAGVDLVRELAVGAPDAVHLGRRGHPVQPARIL